MQLAGEPADRVGGFEVADHVVEGGEVDGEPGPAGRDGQGHGDVGLADAGWAEQRDVRAGLHEGEGGQVADLAGFQVGLEGEVVVVEGLVVRQPRQAQPGAEPAFVADGEFLLQHQVEEVEVAHRVSVGAFRQVVQGAGQVRQAELRGAGLDAAGDQLSHCETSFKWLVRADVNGWVPASWS